MKNVIKTKEFWLGTTLGMALMITILGIFTLIAASMGVIV